MPFRSTPHLPFLDKSFLSEGKGFGICATLYTPKGECLRAPWAASTAGVTIPLRLVESLGLIGFLIHVRSAVAGTIVASKENLTRVVLLVVLSRPSDS